MTKTFSNANKAFNYYYQKIRDEGHRSDSTMYLNNIGFYITNPLDNAIKCKYRNWSKSYAEIEWKWYLSGNRSVADIKKIAKIWDKMHGGDDLVNSNYGYQWKRNNQIDYVINELIRDKFTRRAVISIYDGKEHDQYKYDTPCTIAIVFNIKNNKLNMSVIMRSNDLWYGFCNDQYCFSKLQQYIANKIDIQIGWYYHFANDLHLYNNKLNKKMSKAYIEGRKIGISMRSNIDDIQCPNPYEEGSIEAMEWDRGFNHGRYANNYDD